MPKIVKKLTEKTPSKKENNKLRKFKVLRHGNTGDKLASQKPAKTVTPFHLTVLSVDKCGRQTWFIYEQLMKLNLRQNSHIVVKKVALITKQRQLNAVESTGNQNNQIKPCRFVLTVQQHGQSAEIFNTNDRTHPTL